MYDPSVLTRSNVSLAYWNIDSLFTRSEGLRSCKLNSEEFENCINTFDIIGLVETHCGPSEPLALEGYSIFHNSRPMSSNSRYFGGIAICIKDSIRKGVKMLPITSSEISWIKLCKTFFNLESDLYVAIAYVSPSGSSFSGKRDYLKMT